MTEALFSLRWYSVHVLTKLYNGQSQGVGTFSAIFFIVYATHTYGLWFKL